MSFSGLQALHQRYAVQALWTEPLRERLLAQIKLPSQPRVLEIGSGTGCITSWFSKELKSRAWGIDIQRPVVQYAQIQDSESGYAQADGAALPFPSDCFDLIFCHYLLLWTPNPDRILEEMQRCTRTKGWLIAFAEPDYHARIDFPDELRILGEYQTLALDQMGAHTSRGRQLRGLFSDSGLQQVQAGLLGGEWGHNSSFDLESEWTVLRSDLSGSVPVEMLRELEQIDRNAWSQQERILFVPTFYAFGQKTHSA
jgi:SAM-dependent methyltransferase